MVLKENGEMNIFLHIAVPTEPAEPLQPAQLAKSVASIKWLNRLDKLRSATKLVYSLLFAGLSEEAVGYIKGGINRGEDYAK